MRVVVLTSEPIDAQLLRGALEDDAEDAEVLVVSPALQDSPLRFWMSDADEAIARAHEVQEETVERLDEEGVDAAGDTGESDPLQALADALATFDAERILVFTHPGDQEAYLEEDVPGEAERRFGIPVIHSVVGRGGSFNSGTMDFGKAFTFTFTTPGRFTYFCQQHADMIGEVDVQ